MAHQEEVSMVLQWEVETWADPKEQEVIEAVLTEEEGATSREDLKMMREVSKEMLALKSTLDQEEVLNNKFEHVPIPLILNLKTDIITKH
jgi:S-ribosylhomocysteine lyase LuxS involved in autoinducer biosynthesis